MPYKYDFNRENCWYSQACSKYHTNDCSPNCFRYLEMHYLMNNSGIPLLRQFPFSLKFDEIDREALKLLKSIKDDIENFIANGESLYIYSKNNGNGKTSSAIRILTKHFDNVWAGNGFRCRGIFVHVPTFLTNIRNGISNKDEDFELLKQRIPNVDLVVWDDIAATKLSDFDYSNLLIYIDQRKLNLLSNIYTGNLTLNELSENLGKRLGSRICDSSTVVELRGCDKRGMTND